MDAPHVVLPRPSAGRELSDGARAPLAWRGGAGSPGTWTHPSWAGGGAAVGRARGVRGGASHAGQGGARHWLRAAGEARVTARACARGRAGGSGSGVGSRESGAGRAEQRRGAMIRNGHETAGGAERPGPGGRRPVRVWCDGW